MTTRHAGTDCPSCGMVLDTTDDPTGDAQPKSGDATLCFYCGALLIYADDALRLRRPTPEEVEEAESVPSFQEARALVLEAITRRKLGLYPFAPGAR